MGSRVAFVVTLAAFSTVLSSSAIAQRYLYNTGHFLTGHSPAGVVVADFNRDGKPDLAVASFGDNKISILLGKHNGTFASKVDYGVGISPVALVAGDFNSDQKLDLAVINENDGTVSVLLGNGDGTFQTHVDYATGKNPVGVVTVDFNGDKKLDLAVVNENDSTVSILLGNGDGTFKLQETESVDGTPTALATGDFNGDGKADLITANVSAGTVTVLLSDGKGAFSRVDSPFGTFSGNSKLALGDFNRDGRLDVVVSSQTTQQLFLLLGKGNGTFSPAVAIPNTSGVSIGAMLAGDFNHDGRLDIATGTGTFSGGLEVFLGNGDGTFRSPIESPLGGWTNSVAAADLNGDGQRDLVVTNPNMDSVDVLLGNGKGGFGGMQTVPVAPAVYGPDWPVAADFNGDGKLDLAVSEINFPNGQISVELGKGNGTFGLPLISPLSTSAVNANFMVAGDFDGNGKRDLLVMDSYRKGFEVLLGKGDGTFLSAVDTTLSYTIQSVAVGDFNGDGKTDVAVVPYGALGNPSVNIYLSNGNGMFKPGVQLFAGSYDGIIAADVNKDGKADLVAYSFGAHLQVFLGKGDGTFKAPISGPSDTFSSDMVAGDFNSDGKLDLAVGTYKGVAFLGGNADGTFLPPVHSNTALQFTGRLVAGDFSGDGRLDVLNSPGSTGAIIMIGNGNGTFQTPLSYGVTGVFPNGVVAGDLNLDGVSDFAIPSSGGSTGTALSLYLSSPTLNLFPTTLKFGTQSVGTTSIPMSATLTDVGNSPLFITGVSVSGDYQLTQSCTGKIAVGKNCSLLVTFHPVQIGTRTGSITIKDNAVTSPQIIHLTGIGK